MEAHKLANIKEWEKDAKKDAKKLKTLGSLGNLNEAQEKKLLRLRRKVEHREMWDKINNSARQPETSMKSCKSWQPCNLAAMAIWH